MTERLQKYLARAGIASRRHAEALIVDGRVAVNNTKVTELGTKVQPGRDLITVDGKLVNPPAARSYYAFYKPPGVVTTLEDPQGRATISDFLEDVEARVFPVGRLDYDAEGVLLLTDDGELSHKLLHPSFQVPRTYLAKVKGEPTDETLAKLRGGVRLEDGMATPVSVDLFDKAEKNTWLRIVVAEGRQHLIKRLCAAVGHPVVRLFRPSYAGIGVGGLRHGEKRELSRLEIEGLEAVAKGEAPRSEPDLKLPARRHGHGVAADAEEQELADEEAAEQSEEEASPRESASGRKSASAEKRERSAPQGRSGADSPKRRSSAPASASTRERRPAPAPRPAVEGGNRRAFTGRSPDSGSGPGAWQASKTSGAATPRGSPSRAAGKSVGSGKSVAGKSWDKGDSSGTRTGPAAAPGRKPKGRAEWFAAKKLSQGGGDSRYAPKRTGHSEWKSEGPRAPVPERSGKPFTARGADRFGDKRKSPGGDRPPREAKPRFGDKAGPSWKSERPSRGGPSKFGDKRSSFSAKRGAPEWKSERPARAPRGAPATDEFSGKRSSGRPTWKSEGAGRPTGPSSRFAGKRPSTPGGADARTSGPSEWKSARSPRSGAGAGRSGGAKPRSFGGGKPPFGGGSRPPRRR